jgi:DNA-binding transcriptional regulator YdaS (Cro superfamily)
MQPLWRPFQEPAARKVWLEVLKPVAAQMQTCAPQLAERIVDRFQSELPSVVPDASAVAEQLASSEAVLRQMAQLIETGDDPRLVDLAPATAAIGRSGVQRDIPLVDFIRSVRLAQEQLWQWICDRITATAETTAQVKALELATNWLFAYIEVAGSSHTPETFEDSEMFFYMIGELLFFDQDNKILWQENHKTSVDRYTRYCADNGISARDLTSWDS